MKRNRISMNVRRAAVLALACAAVFSGASGAQPYPNKPVRLVVGFPPGGAADILARIAAQQMSLALKEQVVVDNRGGAGGLVATEITARAVPDGYTLLFTSIPHVINPHLYRKVSYDAVKDFDAVIQFVSVPLMLAATNAFPAHSVKELVALAKAKPGEINYASGGSGASSHLAMELFKSMAGIQMNHIPYKGTGPLITDLIAGQVSVTIASAVPLIPQVRAGKLRGLAVTGNKRAGALPDMPTIAEAGVPGYEVINWFGVVAPAGTPKAIGTRINADLNKALTTRTLIDSLHAQGADPAGGSIAEFAAMIRRDLVKWEKVVRESGARVD